MRVFDLIRKFWVFLGIFILTVLTRLVFLDRIPVAVTGDELEYIINAKAFFNNGRDVVGSINFLSPLLFKYPAETFSQSELQYLLQAPLVGLTEFSLLTARLTNFILSVGTVILMYFLGKELLGKQAGIIASLLTAINPWMIFIGRTGYDMVPAVFFYLFGLYVLIKQRSWKIFYSLPFFILAFYSYIGTKVSFVPFILVASLYAFYVVHKKKYLKEFSAFVLVSVSVIFIYLFLLQHNSPSSRLSEIATPFSPGVENEVNRLRKETLANPAINLFENKLTVFFRNVGDKILSNFSFEYLFVNGDQFYSLWRHGLFYYLDAVFLVAGIALLWSKRTLVFYFLASMSVVAIIPEILHEGGGYFTPHISLLIPFLLLIIGGGISEGINLLKKRLKTVTISVIAGSYFVLFLYFFHLYLFQFPLHGAFDFPKRVLSNYIADSQEKNDKNIFVFSHGPKDLFTKYLFYANAYSKDTEEQVKNALRKKDYSISNVTFLSCGRFSDLVNSKDVLIKDVLCEKIGEKTADLAISRINDGGVGYLIFNDVLCTHSSTKTFISGLTLDDFGIENMDETKFCQTYITKPF